MPDKPWMMRTYSGHSTARASNELYRTNIARGQTGLSVAFDLPTQTGYDPDDPLAHGEVGKVGVPVAHLGHMQQLLDGIPVGEMNTSMTINATAAWLLGLYVANAEDQGVAAAQLRGTTQNDIVKEYLSRGTYIFPPRPSRRLDRRHGRVLRGAHPEVEPDQRLQLPPAGGGRDAGAGDRVRARHCDRCARRGARVGSGRRRPVPRGVRVDQLLRERRHPLRRGDVQDAGLHRAVGSHRPRALRRHRRQGPPVPLRRAGEQPRADRGAAREQRPAHRARGPRRDAVEASPRPVDPAAGVERGARSPPSVGPAVVAAHPTGARARDRPARVRGHLRRLEGGRGEDGGAGRGGDR